MSNCAKSTEVARLPWGDKKARPTLVVPTDSNKLSNRSLHDHEVASGLMFTKLLRQQQITWHRIRNLTLSNQQQTILLRQLERAKTIRGPASRVWCLTISSSWTWRTRETLLFPTTMVGTLAIQAMGATLENSNLVKMSIMHSIQATTINQEV